MGGWFRSSLREVGRPALLLRRSLRGEKRRPIVWVHLHNFGGTYLCLEAMRQGEHTPPNGDWPGCLVDGDGCSLQGGRSAQHARRKVTPSRRLRGMWRHRLSAWTLTLCFVQFGRTIPGNSTLPLSHVSLADASQRPGARSPSKSSLARSLMVRRSGSRHLRRCVAWCDYNAPPRGVSVDSRRAAAAHAAVGFTCFHDVLCVTFVQQSSFCY